MDPHQLKMSDILLFEQQVNVRLVETIFYSLPLPDTHRADISDFNVCLYLVEFEFSASGCRPG